MTPLGPNTPPPHPDHALHAHVGSDRFYVVTKGLRLGVFGSWAATCPYVNGIKGASYTRCSSLYSAFAGYKDAYDAFLVNYV
ncbi:hypothetical protein NMY22_g18161 [Coprinellus aureogranulatus]|nr:hypothetical protein NMY22_g18161 [Coprinellus aureogranulatus]